MYIILRCLYLVILPYTKMNLFLFGCIYMWSNLLNLHIFFGVTFITEKDTCGRQV